MTVTSSMTTAQISVTILMTATTNKIIFVGTTVTAFYIFFLPKIFILTYGVLEIQTE
jgi:hypothetical protein